MRLYQIKKILIVLKWVQMNMLIYFIHLEQLVSQKDIVRDIGGHIVALKWTMKNIYNIEQDDIWWSASDIGWIVGHSYIVYAPLFKGCTTVLFEGKPVGTPDAGAFLKIISDYKVKSLFTAPTAFRAIKKRGS